MSIPTPDADWLAQIFDTMDEGVHAVDDRGITVVYNAAAARLDGLSPEDVIGKHVLSVFPSLGQDTSTLLQVLRTGRPIHNRPQTYTNFLGIKVHTVNTTLPIRAGDRVVGAVEIAKDLTQVRRLAEQMVELQARVARSTRRGGPPPAANSQAVYQFTHIITRDPVLQDVLRRAELAAKTRSPILVYGETGTGKELLVQAIHNAGPRSGGPFVALNCAALPASLLEGILFGTVRGSFTGAEDRPGMFELADQGTLFLDEIQSMPFELQAKLLRAIQEGESMRVGDTRVRTVDVRLVAALNERPESVLEAGRLRADLYYRLNVVRLDLPPLRERRGDIPLLTMHFIDKYNRRFGASVTGVDARVMELFQTYPWPGNVRELENAVESAMNLVSSGAIGLEALPAHLREWARRAEYLAQPGTGTEPNVPAAAQNSALDAWSLALQTTGVAEFWAWLSEVDGPSSRADGQVSDVPPCGGLREVLAGVERLLVARALSVSAGSIQQAARRLGIPRQTLQYRLKQLGFRHT